MSQTTFDKQKCERRNRVAALRDGVNAAPLHLLKSGSLDLAGMSAEQSSADGVTGLLYAHGTLPKTEGDALSRINALRGEDADPLTEDDVWLHYAEAANNNFVGDRFLFLDGSTLRNVAREAAVGFAFMNSHRTGGVSHASELPFGITFAGRYEEYQDGRKRALLGVYMLRGVKPNGDQGPSSDDLHRMVEGGVVGDVSMGLYGGEQVCDVCANELQGPDCSHVPGTKRDMSPDQVAQQKGRGIRGGEASYSIVGAHSSEVSAVYDGAVPGAGFRKMMSLARKHELSRAELRQAMGSYRTLLSKGDLAMEDFEDVIEQTSESVVTKLLKRLGIVSPSEAAVASTPAIEAVDTKIGVGAESLAPQPSQAPGLAVVQSSEYLAILAQRDALKLEALEKAAFGFVESQIRGGKLFPACGQQVISLYRQLALDDEARPTSISLNKGGGDDGPGTAFSSRVAVLEAVFAATPSHGLFDEQALPAAVLTNSVQPTKLGDEGQAGQREARRVQRLSMTALGRSVLKG